MMKKIKVLIVDDEEIVVQGIKKGLNSSKFDVQTILGGQHAIDLLKKEFFDVVFVDLIMPGLNGVETCAGVKKVSPKTRVLLLSGFPKEIEKYSMAFLEAGGRDLFLRKPLMADEVADAIIAVMADKNA